MEPMTNDAWLNWPLFLMLVGMISLPLAARAMGTDEDEDEDGDL